MNYYRLQQLVIVSYLCISFCSFAKLNPEEILKKLKSAPTNHFDSLYFELTKTYKNNKPLLALKYAKLSYQYATHFKHPTRQVKALYAIGFIYKNQHLPDSAMLAFRKGLHIASNNNLHNRTIYFLNEIGGIFEYLDQYDSALINYLKSLNLAKKHNLPLDQAIALNNIGLIYLRLNNQHEAITHLNQAIAIKKQFNISDNLDINFNNLAYAYLEAKMFNQAIDQFNNVIAMCSHNNCTNESLMQAYLGLGESFLLSDNYAEASINLNNAYTLANQSGNEKIIANCLLLIAQINTHHHQLTTAYNQLKTALNKAIKVKNKRLIRDIYLALSELALKQNNPTLALDYKNAYIAVKDSIFNEKLANSLKQIFIDAQRQENAFLISEKESALRKAKTINLLLIIILALSLIIVFLIYKNSINTKLINEKLEKQFNEKNAELKLSNYELLKTRNEYEHLIYRTSHDIRGPLATLIGLTNVASIELSKSETIPAKSAFDYIQKIKNTATGLNKTLSKLLLINNINNHIVNPEPINLQQLIDDIFSKQNKFDHYPIVKKIIHINHNLVTTDRQMITIALEALIENAFFFFNPNQEQPFISVSSSTPNNSILIFVQDNGLGIPLDQVHKIFNLFHVAHQSHGTGMGLFLAKKAIEKINGTISVHQNANPTSFALSIPQ